MRRHAATTFATYSILCLAGAISLTLPDSLVEDNAQSAAERPGGAGRDGSHGAEPSNHAAARAQRTDAADPTERNTTDLSAQSAAAALTAAIVIEESIER